MLMKFLHRQRFNHEGYSTQRKCVWSDTSKENNPKYIEAALDLGFDVEIDVWFDESDSCAGYYLGHDHPLYKIDASWLMRDGVWCHAKNQKALERMFCDKIPNYFWHQEDRFTITSRGDIWCYPNNPSRSGILVDVGRPKRGLDIRGVCTDYANEWKMEYRT
jgi:hypothetical protein